MITMMTAMIIIMVVIIVVMIVWNQNFQHLSHSVLVTCLCLAIHKVITYILLNFWLISSSISIIIHESKTFDYVDRYTGPSCMSTNTIIVTCNAALSILVTITTTIPHHHHSHNGIFKVTALTLLPCTRKSTGGLPPAALQASIGIFSSFHLLWYP